MNTREWASRKLSTLSLTLFAIVLASITICDTEAGEIRPTATIRDTNLRKAPKADAEIVLRIPRRTTVEVDDCRYGWCHISWNGQAGYAVARNLMITPAPYAPVVTHDRGQSQTGKTIDPSDAREQRGAEHSFILEIGSAGEWPLEGERPNFGGTIAAEIEPVENWLELEFGLATLATAGHTEVSGDLLFKKPFRLSPTVEFMIGAGSSFSRTLNGPDQGNSWSAEFALDWMFWPTKDIGWYIEPTWSVNPRNGQQSIAVSIGLLIGLSK